MDGKPLVEMFQEDLEEVIKKYSDQGLTLSEAIGAIEMVKLDLRDNQNDIDQEEDL